jgi:hypothetical protein
MKLYKSKISNINPIKILPKWGHVNFALVINALMIIVFLPGCQATPSTPTFLPSRSLTIEGDRSGVQIQRSGSPTYEALQASQTVNAGDRLRSPAEDDQPLATLRGEDGSLVLIGADTILLVELVSLSIAPPRRRLVL